MPDSSPRTGASNDNITAPVARLELDASAPPENRVDGAWWPRSTDLVAELPSLLDSVRHRVGEVALVGFHRGAWDRTASQVHIAGETIWLEGFIDDEPHTVIVIGSSGRRLTLQVVSPDTSESEASEVLVSQSRTRHGAGSAADHETGNERSLVEVVARLASMEEPMDEQRTQAIDRWVHEAAVQFIDAPVQAFVPILVEHIVRQQISARPQRSTRV